MMSLDEFPGTFDLAYPDTNRASNQGQEPSTLKTAHRPLSSSFLGLPYRVLNLSRSFLGLPYRVLNYKNHRKGTT